MKNAAKKHYSGELKKAVIKRVTNGRFSFITVSRELDLSQLALSKWLRQFKKKGFFVFGQDGIEIKKLRAENKQLKAERDILKKPSVSLQNTRQIHSAPNNKASWSVKNNA